MLVVVAVKQDMRVRTTVVMRLGLELRQSAAGAKLVAGRAL